MNKVIITGNLTADPEHHETPDGKEVCNFTLAVNRRQKDKDGKNIADFFRIGAWGKLGDVCMKFLSKGRKVTVVGAVSCRAYAAQDGTPRASMDVFAEDVEFLPSGNAGEKSDVQPNMTPVNMDGELPF